MRYIFRMSFILLIWTLSMVLSAMAEGDAVIAVAADGDKVEALVSKQAARAPYFLLFDAQGALVEAMANPYQQAARGAGPQVVDLLTAKGVLTLIAGEFGPRMAAAMQGKGMASRTATGSAADAVRQLEEK